MKKISFKLLMLLSFVGIAFIFAPVAHAEEIEQEPTEEEVVEEETTEDEIVEDEVVEEEIVEETVPQEEDFSEMIKGFINNLLPTILAILGGASGTGIVVGIGSMVFKKMIKKMEESIEQSEKCADSTKESSELLKEAQVIFVEGLKAIADKVEESEVKNRAVMEESFMKIDECIGEIGILKSDNAKFKELIALLVSSNPQLASNGYATKILELLNERSESNE